MPLGAFIADNKLMDDLQGICPGHITNVWRHLFVRSWNAAMKALVDEDDRQVKQKNEYSNHLVTRQSRTSLFMFIGLEFDSFETNNT